VVGGDGHVGLRWWAAGGWAAGGCGDGRLVVVICMGNPWVISGLFIPIPGIYLYLSSRSGSSHG
jgi:hypothetical protein